MEKVIENISGISPEKCSLSSIFFNSAINSLMYIKEVNP